jgi:hypothetical protein
LKRSLTLLVSAWTFILFYALAKCSFNILVKNGHSRRVSATSWWWVKLIWGNNPDEGSTTYNVLNRVHCNEEWNEVLYHNSTNESHLVQCLGVVWTAHLKNISRHWLTRSLWLSDCEWFVELNFLKKLSMQGKDYPHGIQLKKRHTQVGRKNPQTPASHH